MEPWQTVDLAWAAGFFEGEGAIAISRYNNAQKNGRVYKSTVLKCIVGQVDPEPLQKLLTLFGGHIKFVNRKAERWSDIFVWELNAKRAAAFLTAIRPYVTRERMKERIDLAIAFQAQKKFLGQSPLRFEYDAVQMDYHRRMKALNRRGLARED